MQKYYFKQTNSRKKSQRINKNRFLSKNIFILILFLIIAFFGYYFLRGIFGYHSEEEYQDLLKAPLEIIGSQRIRFVVEPGSSTRQIAQSLKAAKVIPEDWVFEWYIRRSDLDGKIQAGDYVFREGVTIDQMAEEMLVGKKKEISVTIPEGYRLTQIDNLFAKKGLIGFGEILANKNLETGYGITKDLPFGVDLEGYLFPDTYFFEVDNINAQKIIEKLVWQMGTNFSQEMRDEAKKQGHTIHEILTMASLIERESFGDTEENKTISGILWNRINQGQGLYVDATIQYALGDDWKKILTMNDLQTDSPYNTRKYRGLPPGPICSPSMGSIKAALYPNETEYMYYLHDQNGVVHYAKTNAEHNQNKAKYL